MKIKVNYPCAASGKPLDPKKVYAVGKDVSEEDARALLRMRMAVAVDDKPAKKEPEQQ